MNNAEPVLEQWAVYDHPRDAPPGRPYVVRRWRIVRGRTEPVLDRVAQSAATLAEARALIPEGLFRIPRQAGDDPVLLEVWT
jgi:hypothetical protein